MMDDKCARCGDQLDPRDRYHVDFAHTKNTGLIVRVKMDKTTLCADCFEHLRGEVIEVGDE